MQHEPGDHTTDDPEQFLRGRVDGAEFIMMPDSGGNIVLSKLWDKLADTSESYFVSFYSFCCFISF